MKEASKTQKKATYLVGNGEVTLALVISEERWAERETLTVMHHRDSWREEITRSVYRTGRRALQTRGINGTMAMSSRGFGFIILEEENGTRLILHADQFYNDTPLDLNVTLALDDNGNLRASGTLEVNGRIELFIPISSPAKVVHQEKGKRQEGISS